MWSVNGTLNKRGVSAAERLAQLWNQLHLSTWRVNDFFNKLFAEQTN
jgi:hypothetical protein